MSDNNFGNGLIWVAFLDEGMQCVRDLRWMIVLSIVLIFTDFWWGWSESRMKYKKATTDKEREKYKFHKSKAIRRSANKFVDYLTYLLVGCVLGMAILEPLGICDHVTSAAAGLGLGCVADMMSIVGHYCAVKGIDFDAWKFLKRLVVVFVKKKDEDMGEALEETIKTDSYENNN